MYIRLEIYIVDVRNPLSFVFLFVLRPDCVFPTNLRVDSFPMISGNFLEYLLFSFMKILPNLRHQCVYSEDFRLWLLLFESHLTLVYYHLTLHCLQTLVVIITFLVSYQGCVYFWEDSPDLVWSIENDSMEFFDIHQETLESDQGRPKKSPPGLVGIFLTINGWFIARTWLVLLGAGPQSPLLL